MRTLASFTLIALAVPACADNGAEQDKPVVDPDTIVVSAKADAASNWWTTIVGTLSLGETIKDQIDWPDYYLGRTVELRAGQELELKVSSNRKSVVALYGPATSFVDGQPLFGRAIVKTETKRRDGQQVVTFTAEAPADGTYMLLYGPSNVWSATYSITTTCVSGCLPADACLSDDACAGDEFCGWNGVACIRAPCDAAYDVCQARHDVGGSCARDRECADGLTCSEAGRCVGGTTPIGGACELNGDCADGFCGCAGDRCESSVCKPFAGEGESCGGFRPAHLVQMCSPTHACVAPYDIIADIPGRCGAMTTVAEVLANPAKFDGRFIAIRGVIDAGAAMCTKMACSPANPCCNACGASLRIYDSSSDVGTIEGLYLSEDAQDLGCGGNECTWRDHCAVEPGNHWVSGWFRMEDGGITPRLSLDQRWGF